MKIGSYEAPGPQDPNQNTFVQGRSKVTSKAMESLQFKPSLTPIFFGCYFNICEFYATKCQL